MNKKLILCAPIAMVLASCSTSRMGYVVPESRDTEFQDIAIQGWNTGSVITYGKNHKTGYLETANVTVYQDSGIDNTAKLAHAVGSVAMGTGSVMQGYGAMRYADAMQDYASAYKKIAHDGMKYEVTGDVGTYVNVENSSYSDSAADAYSKAAAEASAGASAGASANIKGYPSKGGHGDKGGHGGWGGDKGCGGAWGNEPGGYGGGMGGGHAPKCD